MSNHVNTQVQGLDPFRNCRSENEGLLYRKMLQVFKGWQRRKTIAALDELDDWILDDIGLCRSQIPVAVDEIIGSDVRPTAFLDALNGAGRRPGFGD